MVLFFVFAICLVLVGRVGAWGLLVLVATPHLWRALRIHSRPRPESAPPDFAYWPLWYTPPAFRLARAAGILFVLALLLDVIHPLRLG